MAMKNNDKYIVTNEIIMNKQNLWNMNMYICISTPNEIFISCFGTINEIFKTGININKIYFNIKFLEQILIHVLMRFLEQVLNFMKIYVTGITYVILRDLDGHGHFKTILISLRTRALHKYSHVYRKMFKI